MKKVRKSTGHLLDEKHAFAVLPAWAEGISVERVGDALVVWGEGRRPNYYPAVSREEENIDPGYKAASLGDNNIYGEMHLDFVNCRNEDDLFRWVQKHGPVNGLVASCEDLPDGRQNLVVEQSLSALKGAQMRFSAVTRLIAELENEKPDPFVIANHLRTLAEQAQGTIGDSFHLTTGDSRFFNALARRAEGETSGKVGGLYPIPGSVCRGVAHLAHLGVCRELNRFHQDSTGIPVPNQHFSAQLHTK